MLDVIDLEPMLAAVRFRGALITRMDMRLVRTLGSPLDPLVGCDLRRVLLELVAESRAAVAHDAEVVPLGAVGGRGVELARHDGDGWTVGWATPRRPRHSPRHAQRRAAVAVNTLG